MRTQSTPETLNPPGSQTLGLGLEPPPSSGELTAPLFVVGDLVWGKIKNHQPPWWPGHVSSLDESDKSVVVSYFGTKISCRCDPSRLKPFAENYDRMSRFSGNSKKRSFKAALNSALSEMGKCLEEQLSCNCNSSLLPEEDRRASRVVSKFSNYSAVEFLGLVKDAAVGCRVGGGVEVIKLRSWVVGFERGVNVGHQQKAISDLVEKIDLDDVPVIETGEWEKEEVEDKSLIVEASHSKVRKKRSMAELIAETGLDSEEEEEKNKESEKDLIGENDNVNVVGVKEEEEEEEEEVGSSRRRERKKSKYLSPPYTYLSERGLAKTLLSSKIPKALSSSKSFSAFEKCSSVEDFQKEEERIQFDEIETGLVFSEFLVTATNPFHLKWNRLAKTVRRFFAEFRSSVFSNGSGFEDYQKKLAESVANSDVCVKSEEGKKIEENKERKANGEVESSMVSSEECKKADRRKGRKKKIQAGVQETPLELVHLTIKHCDKLDNAVAKRKKTKEKPNGDIPQAVTGPDKGNSGRKRRRKKSVGNHNNGLGLGCVTVNNAESGKESGQTPANETEAASTETPAELGTKEETFGKNGKDGTVIDLPINLSGEEITNVSSEGKKSRQRRKIRKTQDPTTLQLTFSSGITLPSIEQLVTACSQYGPLIESETELQMESSSGRVVFKKTSDAEKAFNDKVGALGELVATYHLSDSNGVFSSSPPPVQTPPTAEVPKPPLPSIRKSLERMISTLSGSGSPVEKVGAEASQDMKAEGMDNLVGEMHGLLSKVNKMLTGPAPGTSS